MIDLIVSIAGNSFGLYAANRYVENFVFTGGYINYITAGLFLAFLNFTIKPILKIVTAPIILLSLGLFIIVINALLLWVTDNIFDFISIETTASLILSTILIGFINLVLGIIHKILD